LPGLGKNEDEADQAGTDSDLRTVKFNACGVKRKMFEMRLVGLMMALLAGGFLEAQQTVTIPSGVTLCVQPMTGSFDGFLIGEMQKQKVPVTIIATVPNPSDSTKPETCDPHKSFYTMTGNVVPEGKSF